MRVAINGFGRIGRLFLRQVQGNPDIDVVAINDLGSLENLAYLVKYDTAYRTFATDVHADVARGVLSIGGKDIQFFSQKDPLQLPWKALDIDVVIESTGVFESFEKAKVHVDAGAKHVLITAPAKDADGPAGKTVLMGVNGTEAHTCSITSNGSCTTNAASPVISILAKNPGILKAVLNTVHGYTATQSIVDGPVKGNDFRRGRAAAQNIVPSTTGAAIAVTRAFSELKGKFDGISLRVPVPAGSVADITFIAKRRTSAEEINDIFRNAAKDPKWKNILKVTDEQIVSSDILGEPFGSIVDLGFTKVVDGDLVKVLAWYDNEAGYVATLVEHTKKIAALV